MKIRSATSKSTLCAMMITIGQSVFHQKSIQFIARYSAACGSLPAASREHSAMMAEARAMGLVR